MDRNEMTRRIRSVLCAQLCCDEGEITEDSTLASLGADSLDVVELEMNLEEEFGAVVPDNHFGMATTFTALCSGMAPILGVE